MKSPSFFRRYMMPLIFFGQYVAARFFLGLNASRIYASCKIRKLIKSRGTRPDFFFILFLKSNFFFKQNENSYKLQHIEGGNEEVTNRDYY